MEIPSLDYALFRYFRLCLAVLWRFSVPFGDCLSYLEIFSPFCFGDFLFYLEIMCRFPGDFPPFVLEIYCPDFEDFLQEAGRQPGKRAAPLKKGENIMPGRGRTGSRNVRCSGSRVRIGAVR